MEDNNFSLSQKLAGLLQKKGLMVAVAESCTGGGLGWQLTAVPGSGGWFDRGFIVYNNHAKTELLDVLPASLEEHGAVSEQVALEMALGVLQHSRADIAVSITGIAGPEGGTIEKPVGTVWFGLAVRGGKFLTKQVFLQGGRKQIRLDAVGIAIELMLVELGYTLPGPE